MQNKFCLSKNGIARQYCISLEKENYNDIGTHLRFSSRKRHHNHGVAATLTPGRKTDVEKHNVVTMLVFGCSNKNV